MSKATNPLPVDELTKPVLSSHQFTDRRTYVDDVTVDDSIVVE